MTATVKKVATWVASCSDCPWKETRYTEHEATQAGLLHDEEHLRFRLNGAYLAGKVYDSDHPRVVEYGSTFSKAASRARQAGFSYLSFNHLVRPASDEYYFDPLCRAKDVPGLLEARDE